MNELIQRTLIWSISSIFLGSFYQNDFLTIYVLIGFILSCACCYLRTNNINILFCVFGFLMVFFFRPAGVYLPILFYQIFFKREEHLPKECFLCCLGAVFFLLWIEQYGFISVCMYLLFIALSCNIGMVLRNLNLTQEKIIRLRDDNKEKQELLIERNKMLIEKQNDELHLATLSERNRIAREIHDNVGHTLSRSILQLGALMAVHKDTSVAIQLQPLKETLDDAMNNIRSSVHNLYNNSFDLRGSIDKLVKEMDSYTVNISFDWDNTASTELSYCFLSIVKEGFTNIRKHSNGDHVELSIRELSNFYQLVIHDNGSTDYDINSASKGIGLKNMEDRIRNFNGLIYFSNENGFRIFVSIPKSSIQSKKE